MVGVYNKFIANEGEFNALGSRWNICEILLILWLILLVVPAASSLMADDYYIVLFFYCIPFF